MAFLLFTFANNIVLYHDIPYNDDMDNIEAAYRWYYKCEDEGDDYSPIYQLAMH